eukprot:GEMP01025089.1.p1 GENE.GEMP01025089.1~~GEMP01025089.1.p1  ORF type:complete len:667 (+),score=145.43 GEMP01025089.1:253-2253(+)
MQAVRHREKNQSWQYGNGLTLAMGHSWDEELAKKTSDDMKKNKFVVAQNIIKTLREKSNSGLRQGILAAENFVRMHTDSVDEVLFNSMLDAYGRMQQAEKIDWTLDLMKRHNIPQSSVTWSVLVKSFGKAQKLDRVLETWEQMEELRAQDKVGPITYGCMIDACVKGRRMDEAWKAFQELKKKGKHKNTVIFSTLIKGLGSEGDKDGALALFNEMRQENITCNTITFNSVIDACVRAEDLETAEEIFHYMDCPFDIITISTLIKGFMRIKDVARAQNIFAILKRCGIKPDELSYNTLLDGCVRNGCVELGKSYFIEMVKSSLPPSHITFAILQRLFRLNGYSAEEATVAIRSLCLSLKTPNLLLSERNGRLGGKGRFRNTSWTSYNTKHVGNAGDHGHGINGTYHSQHNGYNSGTNHWASCNGQMNGQQTGAMAFNTSKSHNPTYAPTPAHDGVVGPRSTAVHGRTVQGGSVCYDGVELPLRAAAEHDFGAPHCQSNASIGAPHCHGTTPSFMGNYSAYVSQHSAYYACPSPADLGYMPPSMYTTTNQIYSSGGYHGLNADTGGGSTTLGGLGTGFPVNPPLHHVHGHRFETGACAGFGSGGGLSCGGHLDNDLTSSTPLTCSNFSSAELQLEDDEISTGAEMGSMPQSPEIFASYPMPPMPVYDL